MESLSEQIINLFQENPCLFDKKNMNYKDVKYKEKVWENIAKQINLPVKECKIKWKSLRDRYRKQKMAEQLPSGSAQKIGAPWRHMQSLEFLSESLEPASTTGNIFEDIEDIEDIDESPPKAQTSKKRKTDDLFVDVLLAIKNKYDSKANTAKNYESFFSMLKDKFDKLGEDELDDVQLEILQLVNQKIKSKK